MKSRCHDLISLSRSPRDSWIFFASLSLRLSLSLLQKGNRRRPHRACLLLSHHHVYSHTCHHLLWPTSQPVSISDGAQLPIYIKSHLAHPKKLSPSTESIAKRKTHTDQNISGHECCPSENRFGPSSVPPGSSWFASSLSLPA